MNRRIQQLKAFSLEEWRFLISAMFLLPLVALSIYIRGFKRTQNSLSRLAPKESDLPQPTLAKIEEARIVTRMVAIAGRYGVYRANCLKQSLVLWWLLLWKGIKSEIVFGVPKNEVEDFNAHAWVECNGINLSDSKEVQQRFAALQKSSE